MGMGVVGVLVEVRGEGVVGEWVVSLGTTPTFSTRAVLF